jgi:hypothetical protein
MSAIQRIGAIAVAVIVVIGAAVVAVNLVGGPDGVGSTPTATAEPSIGATATAVPEPSGSAQSEEELLAALREIEQQVLVIRGLPAADIGPADLITRAQLGDELERIFEEEYPPEDRERDEIALRALGLLEEGQDIAELQLQLLGDQVLGFYDDVERRMVIVTDAGLNAEARMTYAHEYTHALQDAAFDFDSLETDAEGEDDRGMARTALIEGDASVTMLAWAFANLSPEELLEITTGGSVPDMTGIPSWMAAQLEFPYIEGLSWASFLVENPISPDFTAIDEAFVDPPDSTEQIIDADAWEAREAPIEVADVDLAGALGDGWAEVDATPIGQAMIAIMLEFHGVDRLTAVEAASGWGGDRAVVATGPDGAFALAWRLAWDEPIDASEFVEAYQGIVGTLGFPASVTELANGDVLVVHASSEDLARRAQDASDD